VDKIAERVRPRRGGVGTDYTVRDENAACTGYTS
jgi:hypothetical protein